MPTIGRMGRMMSISSRNPFPNLDVSFLSTTLDSRVSFSRASTATSIGSNGLIQTAAVDAPRLEVDPVTLAPRGLLVEESRTNLFVNSLVNGVSLATQNVSVTAVPHTISFYGTGTITLSGASVSAVVGTGAYPNRQTLTFTPTLGVLVCTVVGLVQYAQLEVGSFATSFIPTGAAPVTRAADVASMSGSNFSSWYNQTAGTFVVSADTIYSNASDLATIRSVFTADNGTTSNFHRIYQYSNIYGANTIVGGVNQSDISLSSIAANTPAKIAYAYAVNDFSAAQGGILGTPDTSGSLPSPTQLSFGARFPVNGHIRQITYYNRRLPNSLLQTLTA